jgi:hypothetical protein
MTKQCKHPTCGAICRRIKAVKARKPIQRTPIKREPAKAPKNSLKSRAPKKRIQKHSAKRAKINRSVYGPRARVFRENNPKCAIGAPGCTKETQGVHHTEGKATIELLLDETKWLPACNSCNLYIEGNSEWAKQRGFKKLNTNSKLSKFKDNG